jgi:hypothetical protein
VVQEDNQQTKPEVDRPCDTLVPRGLSGIILLRRRVDVHVLYSQVSIFLEYRSHGDDMTVAYKQ